MPDTFSSLDVGVDGQPIPQPSGAASDPSSGSMFLSLSDNQLSADMKPEEYLRRSFKAGASVQRQSDEQAQLLRSQGITPSKDLMDSYKLELAITQRALKGGDPDVVRRKLVPFYSGFYGSGKFESEVQDAHKRFSKGEATDADIEKLADFHRIQENEKWRGETLGRQMLGIASGAPTIIAEFGAAGKALQLGGRAMGLGRAAQVGAADLAAVGRTGGLTPAAMRAALAEPSFASVAASHAGRMGILTPLVPSMWAEQWHQKNIAEGRDPTDLAGMPAAMLHAYGSMLVLGTMQNSFGLTGGAVKKSLVKGGIFSAEQATADSLYNLAAEYLPKGLKVQTHYGTFENLLKGDLREAGSQMALNVFTGAMFAGIHEFQGWLKADPQARVDPRRIGKVIEDVIDGAAKDADTLYRTGLSKEAAGRRMNDLHERMIDAIHRADMMLRPPDVRLEGSTSGEVGPPRPLPGVRLSDSAETRGGEIELRDQEDLANAPEELSLPGSTGDPGEPLVSRHRPVTLGARMRESIARADAALRPLLVRPGDRREGRVMTASEVVRGMKIPGTNTPSSLAMRMSDALRRAEEFTNSPLGELVSEKPTTPQSPPIAPGSRQLSAAPGVGESPSPMAIAPPAQRPGRVRPATAEETVDGVRRAMEGVYGKDGVVVTEEGIAYAEIGGQLIELGPTEHGRVELSFARYADREDGQREAYALDRRTLQKGTKQLFSKLNATIKALAEEGIEIEYTAEPTRHDIYTAGLKRAGYELVKEEPVPGKPASHYVWTPKGEGERTRGASAERRAKWAERRRAGDEAADRADAKLQESLLREDTLAPEPTPPESPTPRKASSPKPEPEPEPTEEEVAAAKEAKWQADRKALDAVYEKAGLTADQRWAVEEFAKGRTLEDIGLEAGVTREAIRQRLQKAQAKINRTHGLTEAKSFFETMFKDLGTQEVGEQRRGRTGASVRESGLEVEEGEPTARRRPRSANQVEYDDAKAEVDRLTEQLLNAEGKKVEAIMKKLKAAGERMESLGRELGIPAALLSGIPIRTTGLEKWLSRFSLGRWLTRNFVTAGELPVEAFRERMKMHNEIEVQGEKIREGVRDLKKALGQDPANLPQPQLEQLNDALGGNRAALAALRPEVQSAILKMRSHVDLLSDLLVKSGAAQGRMALTIQNNVGEYLSRQYRVFTDPRWEEYVLSPDGAAIRNRFISWMDAEIRASGRTPKPGESEGIMKSLLVDGTAAENPIAFLKNGKLSSKDLGILTKRKDVPAPLRELWGEFKDPVVNYATTVGRMAHLLQNHLFQQRVAQIGLSAGWLTKEPVGDTYWPLAPKDSKTLDGFAGLYTTKEIARAFAEAYKPDAMPGYMRAYMKVLGFTKYAKTVMSFMTHVTNAVSNIGFLVRNGHMSVTGIAESIRAMRDDSPAGRKYYEELLRHGIVNDAVMANEFKETMNDALDARDVATEMAKVGMVTDRALVRFLKRGSDFFQKLYRTEDAYAKIVAYESEKARYKKANPTWTDAQVREKAADNVRRTYPSYSQVPLAVRAIRKVPFIGPFVSFSSEVVRTTYHTAKLAFEELNSGNAELKAVGAKRLAFLSLSLGLSAGLAATTRALTMTDRDEENDMRRFLPEWERDTQLLHLGNDSDGNKMFQSLGRIDPHAYLTDAVEAGLHGESIPDAVFQSGLSLAKPFISEEVLSRAIVDVARNVDERTGKPIYNDQDTTRGILLDVAKHLGKPLLPGTAERAARSYAAYWDNPDRDKALEKLAYDILAEVSPVKLRSVEPAKGVRYKYRDFKEDTRNAEAIFEQALRSPAPVSPKRLKALYDQSEARRRELFDRFREDVQAAERLGASRESIFKSLRDAGVSAEEIGRVFGGAYRPNVPRPDDAKQLPPGEFAKRLAAIRQ